MKEIFTWFGFCKGVYEIGIHSMIFFQGLHSNIASCQWLQYIHLAKVVGKFSWGKYISIDLDSPWLLFSHSGCFCFCCCSFLCGFLYSDSVWFNLYRHSPNRFKNVLPCFIIVIWIIKPLSIPQQTLFLPLHVDLNHEENIWFFMIIFMQLAFWIVRPHCGSHRFVHPVKRRCFFACYRVQSENMFTKEWRYSIHGCNGPV